jgi:adenosylcobyric acid synthase
VVIAVPVTPRIANFDDLDPLREEPGVEVRLVEPGEPLPAEAALVLLPGSKTTIDDLLFIREQGWDIDLKAHVRRGGRVLGLCGGYQMLGRRIEDPHGIEGEAGRSVEGLGLLDVTTTLTPVKRLEAVTGVTLPDGAPLTGYEMHIGETSGPGAERAFARLHDGRRDGAVSGDGRVAGTYVHGFSPTIASGRDGWAARRRRERSRLRGPGGRHPRPLRKPSRSASRHRAALRHQRAMSQAERASAAADASSSRQAVR